jgi:hypothetical protein
MTIITGGSHKPCTLSLTKLTFNPIRPIHLCTKGDLFLIVFGGDEPQALFGRLPIPAIGGLEEPIAKPATSGRFSLRNLGRRSAEQDTAADAALASYRASHKPSLRKDETMISRRAF